MGSFSWTRADDLGKYENIYDGCAFKFLVPKEFGGGFIRDHYQGYGNLGTRELPYDHAPSNKYDIYELLAFWNREQVKPVSTKSLIHEMVLEVGSTVTIEIDNYQRSQFTSCAVALNGKQFIITEVIKDKQPESVFMNNPFRMPRGYRLSGEAAKCGIWAKQCFKDTTWYEPLPAEGLKYDGNVVPLMPEISKYTSHNRSLGIYLCYEEVEAKRKEVLETQRGGDCYKLFDQGNFLKYPLKLVSVGFKGTYEDCTDFSRRDPDQGLSPRKRAY